MSDYFVSIFRDQVIFTSDRRIIEWKKLEGKIFIKKTNNDEPKYSKINSHTFFLGPSYSILSDRLEEFLRRKFGDCSVCLDTLMKERFNFQREAARVIEIANGEIEEWLSRENLTREEIGENPYGNDSYLCGVDRLGRPYIIDFRENFKFKIYLTPGTVLGLHHDKKMDLWISRKIKVFQLFINNFLHDRLPKSVRRKIEQNFSMWIFSTIIKKVAKEDFRVGGLIDVVKIDRNGSEILRVC